MQKDFRQNAILNTARKNQLRYTSILEKILSLRCNLCQHYINHIPKSILMVLLTTIQPLSLNKINNNPSMRVKKEKVKE